MPIKEHIIEYQENMQITEPCIIRNMPDDIYHSIKGISSSGIKLLLNCPAKFDYRHNSGQYAPKENKDFKVGKACHKYILEGKEAFEQTYWLNSYFGMDKQTLLKHLQEKFSLVINQDLSINVAPKNKVSVFEYKQQISDLKFLLNTLNKYDYDAPLTSLKTSDIVECLLKADCIFQKEIELNHSELNQIVNMARAIKNHEHAHRAFQQDGESELSLFWIDEKTGLWLKCRPDFLPYDCEDVADYKTTKSAEPQHFFNDFMHYGYHQQAAFYKMGIYKTTKHLLENPIDVRHFFFVAQEKEAPHIAQIYLPCDGLVEHGLNAVYKALEIYQDCVKTGIWKAYTERIIEISLSPKPDDLYGNFDEVEGIIYAPKWIDGELMKYL